MMTGIETFGWFGCIVIALIIGAIVAWCGFCVMHWAVNSEMPFLRTALIVSAIILIAKLATPAAADEYDVLADQLLEHAAWGEVEEGLQTIQQIYDLVGGTEHDWITVMDRLSIETKPVPVTMYRFIHYCLSQNRVLGPLWFFEIDQTAAMRYAMGRGL